MTPNIYTEIPIDPKDASRRGFDLSLCKLVISFSETEKQGFLELARLIHLFRPSDAHIFITSISEFVPLNKALQRIPEKSLISLNSNTIKVETIDGIRELLSSWEAEALVVFFTTEVIAREVVSNLTELEPRWWMLSKTNYEIPFLKQLMLCDPFLFFSQSRMSLEILGSRNQIDRLRLLTCKPPDCS